MVDESIVPSEELFGKLTREDFLRYSSTAFSTKRIKDMMEKDVSKMAVSASVGAPSAVALTSEVIKGSGPIL